MSRSLRNVRLAPALGSMSAALALLVGCSGGGGGGGVDSTPRPSPTPTPSPVPTPSPTPSPSPTPTPPVSLFETPEYQRSDGPQVHRAIPAWQTGATGRGVTVAIVDSGIDIDSPEFAGRISPASADVAGSRTINGEDDHGNMVALIAAAARDNTGILGIAFDSTIQVLRADAPGTCATERAGDPDSGCKFPDSAIAAGVDRAVGAGARVINLSIGGSTISPPLSSAIGRAAAAGVVVVVAAGNDADSRNPALNPNEVDPFAASTRAAGSGNVLIAGSVDLNGVISSFSNRAGSNADAYLAALGEEVCCVYDNGALRVTTDSAGRRFVTLVSGTSFSAPQISGAVALLAQAFPNLTGRQIVALLLQTARDAGAPGTDPVYGRGILDIANAFAPQGRTTLAGSTSVLPLGDDALVTGPAMGDAGGGQPLGAVILDGFSRAYALDLARSLRNAQVAQKLAPALLSQGRSLAAGNDRVSLAFSIDGRLAGVGLVAPMRLARDDAATARVLAARVTATMAPGRQIGFAFREGADGLAAQLQGQRSPAFLIAGAPGQSFGFSRTGGLALAYRQMLGGTGLTVTAESGEALTERARFSEDLRRRRQQETAQRLGIALDRRFGELDTSVGLSWLNEKRTVLGARFHDALGAGGADSLFIDLRAGWQLAPDWRLGAAWRGGWTVPRAAGRIESGSRLLSQAFSVDLEKVGVLMGGDRLALRLSQPLRVESGGVSLDLPVAYDYATLQASYGSRFLPLAPRGREMIGELSWRGELWGGDAGASLYYRKDPGHFAGVPDDQGVAVQWRAEF